MSLVEAIILGLIQGITEFLPISSDGHLELGKILFGLEDTGLAFTMVVHLATVCSIVVVFWKDIVRLLTETFRPVFRGRPEWNASTRLSVFLILSMLPAIVAYLVWGEQIESFFTGDLLLVGVCMLVNAVILFSTLMARQGSRPLNAVRVLLIGIAQAVAMLPGVSRSGSTISTGLLLGIDKDQLLRFSFLMVLLPIAGGTYLELRKVDGGLFDAEHLPAYVAGFVMAFLSGLAACKWMLNLVRKGKMAWFGVYCAVVGSMVVAVALLR